jgi:hypothetical protein
MRKIILFMQVSLDGCCCDTPRSRRCGTPLRHVPAALLKRFLNAGRESWRWRRSGRPLPRAGGTHDWTRP